MALRSRAAKRQPQLSTRPNYVRGFIQRVHRLLWMGYERMQPVGRFATWKEEELSEELANAMQTAIEEAGAPAWVHRFAIHCERPISLPSRRGKRRPRIDIELERTMVG